MKMSHLCLFNGLLLFFMVMWPAGTIRAKPIAEVAAVWAVLEADQKTIVKYAWVEDKHWTAPKTLPLDQGLHVTPVIVPGNDMSIWIVWIEQTADENILRYATVRGDNCSTGRVLDPGNEQSYAPTVLRDHDGTIWITWSQVVNRYADIFTVRWNGTSWDRPKHVNQVNDSPDITPLMGSDEAGNVWVSWFGFTAEHRFVQYVADYRNDQWSVRPEALTRAEMKNFVENRSANVLELPEDFSNRLMGAVFNNSGSPIQSVSDHFRLPHKSRRP